MTQNPKFKHHIFTYFTKQSQITNDPKQQYIGSNSPTRYRHVGVPAEVIYRLTLVHLDACTIGICRKKKSTTLYILNYANKNLKSSKHSTTK